jgi:Smg protein
MFEILVYLFENYAHVDACPAPDLLARKLSAAGFEEEDISAALDWLSGLDRQADNQGPQISASSLSFRAYSKEECTQLDSGCRGFIAFLEGSGVLNPLMREIIIERASALSEGRLTLAKLKVIVLIVLWSQHQALDALILEELLSDDEQARFH